MAADVFAAESAAAFGVLVLAFGTIWDVVAEFAERQTTRVVGGARSLIKLALGQLVVEVSLAVCFVGIVETIVTTVASPFVGNASTAFVAVR